MVSDFWKNNWTGESAIRDTISKRRGKSGRGGLKRGKYEKVYGETPDEKLARKKKILKQSRAREKEKRRLRALPRQQRKAAKRAKKIFDQRFAVNLNKVLRAAWKRTKWYAEAQAAARKKYQEENRERIAATAKKGYWRRYTNPETYKSSKISAVKCRAKENDLEFDLTVEDMVWPTHCPVFGVELVYSCGNGYANTPSVPSIDRIDPTKGYTLDNVQVISMLANAMKLNATEAQLKMFAEWVLDSQKIPEKI